MEELREEQIQGAEKWQGAKEDLEELEQKVWNMAWRRERW